MKIFSLLSVAAALSVSGCGSTTYQRAVKAEAAAPPATSTVSTGPCPTMAPKGSVAYLECERALEKGAEEMPGIGGSGVSDVIPQSSCADPASASDPEVQRICGLAK